MARQISLPSAGTAKIRSPFAPALLPYVTFFIYLGFWWYTINRELADFGRAKGSTELGDSPFVSLLAVTLGWIVIVPAMMSIYNTYKRVCAAQRLAGLQVTFNGWLFLVLYLVIAPAAFAYQQTELNKVWEVLEPAPAAAAPGSPGSMAGGPEAVQPPPSA